MGDRMEECRNPTRVRTIHHASYWLLFQRIHINRILELK